MTVFAPGLAGVDDVVDLGYIAEMG